MSTSAPAPPALVDLPSSPSVRAHWRLLLRASLRERRMQIGLVMTGFIVFLAIFGPLLAPDSPDALVGSPFEPPSDAALLGTDYLGQDVFSRLLYGGRTVVWMSLSATALGAGIGVLIGMLAGYSRGWLDEALMRPLDILLAFPQIVLALLVVSMLGPSPLLIVCLVALAWIPGVARIARGTTAEAASKEYVEAAQALGVPRRRILIGEILPNLTTPLMVEFGLRLTWSTSLVAALSFLGFGIQPPTVDWGLMIDENRLGLTLQPWGVLAPVLCIGIFAVGTNLMTEGLARTIAGTGRRGSAG